MEENKLPDGWVWTTVEELAKDIQYGYTESAEDEPVGPKFLRITDIQSGWVDWDSVPFCICSDEERSKYLLRPNDIVFARTGATTGKSYLIRDCPEAIFASYLIRLRFEKLIDSKYIAFFLDSPMYWSQIMMVRKGSAQPGVNAAILATLILPLAPLLEQQRIVAAIEQQFTRLDAAVAALKSAKMRLKRYRAAVLKAAVEGELTEAWRAKHPTSEPASQLLARILQERRAKWEADLRAKGKDPAKVKYVEPATPNVSGLPELPEGWCWSRAEQICDFITKGTTPSAEKLQSGNGDIPFIKVYNLTNYGTLDFTINPTFVSRNTHTNELARSKVYPGDVLMNIVGPPLGKVSVIPDTYEEWNINQAVVIFRPMHSYNKKFLSTALLTESILSWAIVRAKATAGQFNLTLEICRDLPLPIPPLDEQQQIVSEVERRLSIVSQLETLVEADLKRAERLRQSILKEAFAGRLVPQDPNDEPASVLLERIRQEREAASNQGKGRKQSKHQHTQSNKYELPEQDTFQEACAQNQSAQEPELLDESEIEQVALWNAD